MELSSTKVFSFLQLFSPLSRLTFDQRELEAVDNSLMSYSPANLMD